jgi:hypothetical protein
MSDHIKIVFFNACGPSCQGCWDISWKLKAF